MSWPCSWWEATGRSEVSTSIMCPETHQTRLLVGMMERERLGFEDVPWPKSCETCGHVFDEDDDMGRTLHRKYEWRCPATGEVTLKLPAGALYDNTPYHDWRTGEDGRSLMCVLPNGHHWFIDSRASNCGRPDDDEHYCWCRHGDPEQPETMHVDKSCKTCTAGAGSIQSGDFHGFLHHGAVTTT